MRRRNVWGALLALGITACGGDEPDGPVACYDAGTSMSTADLCAALGDACDAPSGMLPALSDHVTVVPDAASMPEGVVSQPSHNNLDIAWHDGRLFFAFRTAPNHFASAQVYLYVVSTTNQKDWVLETSIHLEKDLREPRFLSVGGKLILYFGRLGEIPLTFKPEAIMLTERVDGCVWTEPEEIDIVGEPGFIPWRTRNIDGTSYMIGYVGGENIYEVDGQGVRNFWLKTEDGRHFDPVDPNHPVVLEGGSSETDWAFLDDGSVLAVSRNESGDDFGFGSKICSAPASALGDWTCVADPKKYDSPLVFKHGSDVYLVGRRQVAHDGDFDLGKTELTLEEQSIDYQLEYWGTPKRCALWKVNADPLGVEYMFDLPSNGDTCFASEIPISDTQHLLYNYTSPLDDPDLSWRDGQFGTTSIYRTTLTFP